MIARGGITYSAAITLRDLTHKDQEAKAAELAAAGGGVAEAKRQEQIRKGSNGSGNGKPKTVRGKGVKVATLRKVAANEEFMGQLEPQARDTLLWILGDESAVERIEGLASLIDG
jgi:hypothetical protein